MISRCPTARFSGLWTRVARPPAAERGVRWTEAIECYDSRPVSRVRYSPNSGAAKLLFNEPRGERRANVHVRKEGNPNQRYPLLFRDYLRAHSNSARTIDRIKRELVKHHADDVEAYYDIKDPVYDPIWDAALEWARHTGWDTREGEKIASRWPAAEGDPRGQGQHN